jgi:hypothetical protein
MRRSEMKVYVVVCEYLGNQKYKIERVFSTEKVAQDFIKNKCEDWMPVYRYKIEEWDVEGE